MVSRLWSNGEHTGLDVRMPGFKPQSGLSLLCNPGQCHSVSPSAFIKWAKPNLFDEFAVITKIKDAEEVGKHRNCLQIYEIMNDNQGHI